MEKLKTKRLSDKELRKFGLDFWLTQEMEISEKEFSDTFQRNDLDLIIPWIKFFGTNISVKSSRKEMLGIINSDGWYTNQNH